MKPNGELFTLITPSNKTIQNYLPIIKYYNFDEMVQTAAEKIKKLIPQGQNELLGCIAFDEFEIKPSLTFDKHTRSVIGLVDDVKEKHYEEYKDKNLQELMITKLTQFFFVSLDSKISIPIGYIGNRVIHFFFQEKF
jgi:hypothetical protein